MKRLIPMVALCWAVDAHAKDFSIGAGIDLSGDLGDPNMEQGASKMSLGPTVRAPIRLTLHPVVAVRSDVFISFQGGQDRIEWSQYNGVVDYHSDDHWTMLSQMGLSIGPEISPWSSEAVSPYAGTNVGVAWARHWHSFQGPSAVLLDPDANDVNSGSNIDPYTDQLAPSVGLHTGVRFKEVLLQKITISITSSIYI